MEEVIGLYVSQGELIRTTPVTLFTSGELWMLH